MADRFDRFTARARRVLMLAQEEAQRLRHNYIGTEHLLLGLIREGEGVAAKVLTALDVDLDVARGRVEGIIGRGKRGVFGEVGLTPRSKKVIELAMDEARRMNHGYVGTEHLLLGLLREGSGIGAGVLEDMGINLKRARYEVMQALNCAIDRRRVGRPTRSTIETLITVAIAVMAFEVLRRRISWLLFH
jgi:ATP-dependent Clp protease ATP-binding subunit ClpC